MLSPFRRSRQLLLLRCRQPSPWHPLLGLLGERFQTSKLTKENLIAIFEVLALSNFWALESNRKLNTNISFTRSRQDFNSKKCFWTFSERDKWEDSRKFEEVLDEICGSVEWVFFRGDICSCRMVCQAKGYWSSREINWVWMDEQAD